MKGKLFFGLAGIAIAAVGANAADGPRVALVTAPAMPAPMPAKALQAPIGERTESGQTYVFTAPPRETRAQGEATYAPIAEHLSRVTGKTIVYKHPDNWISYQSSMQKGEYDLVFDGPHFVAWRIARRDHEPLAKLPGDFIFVFLARQNDARVADLKSLAGRRVCGHAPPNQGTLRLYAEFTNPSRVPNLVQIKGWPNIYKGLVANQCDGAVVPLKIYQKLDPKQEKTRILRTTEPVPSQAFTAGPRFTAEDRRRMADALLSNDGLTATAKLRERFPATHLLPARKAEYAGIEHLLKDSYGFGG